MPEFLSQEEINALLDIAEEGDDIETGDHHFLNSTQVFNCFKSEGRETLSVLIARNIKGINLDFDIDPSESKMLKLPYTIENSYQKFKFTVYVPEEASCEMEHGLLGYMGDLKEEFDEITIDASKEILSNIFGSFATQLNHQKPNDADIYTVKHPRKSKIVKCKERLIKVTFQKEDENIVIFNF